MAARSEGLETYLLEGVEETRVEIGTGSYGSVIEVYYRGLKCAAKKIYRLLYEGGVGDRLERFTNECRTMSSLRHPNIVQFLGVYFERGIGPRVFNVPVLVMEYLPTTLSNCIDQHGALPDEVSYPILRDVALGLRYLHEQAPIPLVHRDLSANNVLLTHNMVAKISDMGVAKLLHDHRLSQNPYQRLTSTPGTPSYMPPEAMLENPDYNSSIDMFSFGAMVLHVACGTWPIPIDAVQPTADNPYLLHRISEVERRQKFIDCLGERHPLLGLIRDCLSNTSSKRPTAAAALQTICHIMQNCPQPRGKMEVLQQKNQLQRETSNLHQALVQTTRRNRQLLVSKLSLEDQLATIQLEAATKESELSHVKGTLEKTRRDFAATSLQLNHVSEEKRDALSEANYYQQMYSSRCDEITGIEYTHKTEIQRKDAELRMKDAALTERESVVRNLSFQLSRARDSILKDHVVSFFVLSFSFCVC